MKVITISGRPGSGKSIKGEQLYKQYQARGVCTALIDTDSYGDYYTDPQARTTPAVKIVTKLTDGDLRVEGL